MEEKGNLRVLTPGKGFDIFERNTEKWK